MPTEPAQPDAPTHTKQVTATAGGLVAIVPEQTAHKDASTVRVVQVLEIPIVPKTPLWSLGPVGIGTFPPGEFNRQGAHTHEGLYRAYVVGEANTRAANHQIVREWRTMVRE
ncbi:hypothetical protein Hanom_Chr02g00128811 [Helianthus anomalus]